MLELKNLTKTFGSFKALEDLTMTVPKGAVYGLVGPNGAGKSTALRHLTGVYRQDAGLVTMEGQPIYENPAIKSRIGYIPDDIFFYPHCRLCAAKMADFPLFLLILSLYLSDHRYTLLYACFTLLLACFAVFLPNTKRFIYIFRCFTLK